MPTTSIRTAATDHFLTPANSQTLWGRGRQKKGTAHSVSPGISGTQTKERLTPSSDPQGLSQACIQKGGLVGEPEGPQETGRFKGSISTRPLTQIRAPSEFPPHPGHWLLY